MAPVFLISLYYVNLHAARSHMEALEFSLDGYKLERLPLTKMRENTKEQCKLLP